MKISAKTAKKKIKSGTAWIEGKIWAWIADASDIIAKAEGNA